jgi:hypothetical protein
LYAIDEFDESIATAECDPSMWSQWINLLKYVLSMF